MARNFTGTGRAIGPRSNSRIAVSVRESLCFRGDCDQARTRAQLESSR
jgi:hypothetical protein